MSSSIKLTDLLNDKTKHDFTYVDLKLDIGKQVTTVNSFERPIPREDLATAYDQEAIKNSLVSIFNTAPGQRPLYPLFGCRIEKYLFRPVNAAIGEQIGNAIKRAIELWEPRVRILKISVMALEDLQEYRVDLNIYIPKLNNRVRFDYVIDRNGNFYHDYQSNF